MGDPQKEPPAPLELQRHFGLLHATALNVTMIVGAGVFVTIPLMLARLPGPYALLGWLAAGALILVDGMIWGELGAALPGSGGSYRYLLECYGPDRWGRLTAFLFVWLFVLSGPLEIASGLIAIAIFLNALDPGLAAVWWRWDFWPRGGLSLSVGPSRLIAFGLGVLILVLLYRRVRVLARLTLVFWLGVLGVIVWILVAGAVRFDPATAFDFSGRAAAWPADLWPGLGAAMSLALYSYFGYYNICYVGDEVRDPGRTIPRSVLLSALLVILLFVGLHLAMLGTVSWRVVPAGREDYSLAADFMRAAYGPHGRWAVVLVTLLLVWSSFGSAFAGLLGYSRIPYGAARYGHFFTALGRVHPRHFIPHLSLLLVGGLTLWWTFFDLGPVIVALVTTRILGQFVVQVVGVVLLRRNRPELPRPYRMWLSPLPCGLALAGWLYVYLSADGLFIVLGLAALLAGGVAFLAWSKRSGGWPFGPPLS